MLEEPCYRYVIAFVDAFWCVTSSVTRLSKESHVYRALLPVASCHCFCCEPMPAGESDTLVNGKLFLKDLASDICHCFCCDPMPVVDKHDDTVVTGKCQADGNLPVMSWPKLP